MFTTLRYDKDRLLSSSTNLNCKHIACLTCRSRKLKCSGEKDGCRRCRAREIDCQYIGMPWGQSRRKRRRPVTARSLSKSPPGSSDSSINGCLPMRDDSVLASIPHSSSPGGSEDLSAEHTGISATNGLVTSGAVDIGDPQIFLDEDFTLSPSSRDIFTTNGAFGSPDLFWDPGPMLLSGDGNTLHLDDHTSDYQQTIQNPIGNHPFPYDPVGSLSSTTALQNPGQPPPTCTKSCVQTILSYLSIMALSQVVTLGSIPCTLNASKTTLSALPPLLQCTACSHSDSHLSLLIVLSQYLITSYETVLNVLTSRYIELHPNFADRIRLFQQAIQRGQILTASPRFQPPVNGDSRPDGREDGDDGAAIKDGENKPVTMLHGYEVEPSEEPCLFAGLVTLQLKALMRFSNNLKEVVGTSKKRASGAFEAEGQVLLIQGVERRIMAQLWIVGACGRNE